MVTAYEAGATWEQIGRALGDGITRQSAHAKYAPAVAEFREQLAAAIRRAGQGEDPLAPARRRGRGSVTRPGMPRSSTRPSPLSIPACSDRRRPPGSSSTHLSARRTAAPAQLAGVRGPDAQPLRCRHTRELDDPYLDGMYSWLACTLPEGHPGRQQLAVTGEE